MKKTERAKLLDKVYGKSNDGWSGDAFAVSPDTVVKMLLAERGTGAEDGAKRESRKAPDEHSEPRYADGAQHEHAAHD